MKRIVMFIGMAMIVLHPVIGAEPRATELASQTVEQSMRLEEGLSNVTAQTVSSSRIDLCWEYTGDRGGLKGFVIFRKQEGGHAWEKLSVTPGSVRAFCDKNLRPQTRYLYRIHALTSTGVSSVHETAAAITLRGYRRIVIVDAV